MNSVASAGWRGRVLETCASTAFFGWISFSPLAARWVHTSTTDFAWPVVVVVGSLLALLVARTPQPSLIDRRDWPLWCALLGLAIAAATAVAPPEHAAPMCGKVCLFLGGSYYVGKAIARVEPERHLVAVVLPMSVCVALYACFEVITGGNVIQEQVGNNPYYSYYREFGRPVATQFNPAPLGTYLAVTLVWCSGAVVAQRRSSAWRRIARYAALGALLAGLALTRSRGACMSVLIAALGGVALSASLSLTARLRLLALGIAGTVTLMAIASALPPPYDQFGYSRVLGDGGLLAQDRAIRRAAALSMWRAHPLSGVGFDGYPQHFTTHAGADPRVAHLAGTPDNTYLGLLAENGVVGAGAVACLLLVLVGRGVRACWAQSPAVGAPLRLAATAALVALTVNFIGYSALHWIAPCLLLGFSCGLLQGLLARA